jgi:hypothetical protein
LDSTCATHSIQIEGDPSVLSSSTQSMFALALLCMKKKTHKGLCSPKIFVCRRSACCVVVVCVLLKSNSLQSLISPSAASWLCNPHLQLQTAFHSSFGLSSDWLASQVTSRCAGKRRRASTPTLTIGLDCFLQLNHPPTVAHVLPSLAYFLQ